VAGVLTVQTLDRADGSPAFTAVRDMMLGTPNATGGEAYRRWLAEWLASLSAGPLYRLDDAEFVSSSRRVPDTRGLHIPRDGFVVESRDVVAIVYRPRRADVIVVAFARDGDGWRKLAVWNQYAAADAEQKTAIHMVVAACIHRTEERRLFRERAGRS
jgi:hypothetical protein